MDNRMILFVAACLSTAPAYSSPVPQSQASARIETKYKGEVRKYTPGSLLEVDIGDKRSKAYDLTEKDTTYSIDPHVAIGRRVSITESRDSAGRKAVEVRLGG